MCWLTIKSQFFSTVFNMVSINIPLGKLGRNIGHQIQVKTATVVTNIRISRLWRTILQIKGWRTYTIYSTAQFNITLYGKTLNFTLNHSLFRHCLNWSMFFSCGGFPQSNNDDYRKHPAVWWVWTTWNILDAVQLQLHENPVNCEMTGNWFSLATGFSLESILYSSPYTKQWTIS